MSHRTELTDPDRGRPYPVRHLSIHSSALGHHAAKRREAEIEAIEAALQRLQGWINTYDDKSPEVIARRVQQKAFKKRSAQRYVDLEVVTHADRPSAPYALHYPLNEEYVARDAE